MTLGPQQTAEQVADTTVGDPTAATNLANGRRIFGRGKRTSEMAGKSPTQIALARLRRDKVAMICLAITLLFVLIAIFAPLLAGLEGQTPDANNYDVLDPDGLPLLNSNAEHWLGVEPNTGRDLFARFVYGARPSIAIGTIAALASTVIGVVIGLIAGYFGGWIDRAISWVIDFVLSLPFLIFAIALVPVVTSWFGDIYTITDAQVARARMITLAFVLIAFSWAGLARLVRGEVLSMREKEFVQAARALGVPTRRILFKEMLPNLIGVIIVSFTMAVPSLIASEAGLSMLGAGLKDPTPSWGVTIASASNYYQVFPLYLWVPVAAVALLVLAMSLLGDAIADAFNPNTRR